MYVSDLVRVLRRRWYIAIPGLLLTIIAAGLVVRVYPPSLQATGSVLLISPSTTGPQPGTETSQAANPYLNFGAPLGATAEVVSAAVNSDQAKQQLSAAGATGTYSVGTDPNSSAPLMSVQATARTSAKAMATLNAVIHELRVRLDDIQTQAGAPRDQYIRAQPVTISPKAVPVHGSLIRALAVLGIVGVLASCGAAVIAEGMARGRARKRGTVEQSGSEVAESRSSVDTAAERPDLSFEDRDREEARSPATSSRSRTP